MATQDLTPDRLRLTTLSDAFIAVVLVVMAADLRGVLPDPVGHAAGWIRVGPGLFAYLLAFFTLGVVWVNHSLLTGAFKDASRITLWLNLGVLFWISMFPLAVRLLSRAEDLREGCVAYGLALTGMAATIFGLRAYLWRSTDRIEMALLSEAATYRSGAALLISAGSIPLAFASPAFSIVCFAVAPAIFLLPEPKDERT